METASTLVNIAKSSLTSLVKGPRNRPIVACDLVQQINKEYQDELATKTELPKGDDSRRKTN